MVETQQLVAVRKIRLVETAQAPSRRDPGKSNLLVQRSLFVDNARFWSMLAIVALHCTNAVLWGRIPQALVWLVDGFLKFGTITFFLIAGFLLGERFEHGNPFLFLRRRMGKILLPWLAWFAVMSVLPLMVGGLKHKQALAVDFETMRAIGSAAFRTLTGTAFWFVPNYFLSICLLLLVRKSLRRMWLGIVLFLITLFYTVNIYAGWIASAHALAVGGYVFFLWLGALISRRYEWLVGKLQNISIYGAFLIAGSLALLSFGEAHLVHRLTSADPLNTLRITNQLYSLGAVLLMLRLRRPTWPGLLDVRNQMFGVYLTHSLVLLILEAIAKRVTRGYPPFGTFYVLEMVAIAGACTILVFSLSAGLTVGIGLHTRLRWLVGER